MSGSSLYGHRQSVWPGSAVLGVFTFCCGVILLYTLAVLPPSVWFLGCLLFILLWFLLTRRLLPAGLWVCVIGLAAGFSWAGVWANERLDQRLPPDFEGKSVEVSGYVCNLPSVGSFNSIRFSFCVTRWHSVTVVPQWTGSLPRRLRLAWYGQSGSVLPAHKMRLEVRLKRPHGSLNPKGFRYEDWLFRKGYRATGSVRDAQPDPLVSCSVECRYYGYYTRLAAWVDEQFASARYHSLIASLLIGNRGHLSSQHWDVFKATGTIHLVAISGLHLGLVALGAGFVARRALLAVSAYRMSERSVRLIVFAAVVLCCVFYALAAGFTVPTRRALVMVAVGGWLLLMARQVPVWHSFVVALGLVLLLDPFAPLDQGFWLSFGAVSVLMCAFSGRLGGTGWLAGLFIAQAAVFAGLWPLLDLVGQSQPVAGLLANMFAIPWVSLVVMPVLITGGLLIAVVPALAGSVIPVMDAGLGVMWYILQWIAGIDWPNLNGSTLEAAGFAVLVLLVVVIPARAFRVAGAALIVCWMLAASMPQQVKNPRVVQPQVQIWDVGQGLSAMVRVARKVLLYDTGPEVKGVFSAAESVLIPNLKSLGIRRIDTLVISHADNDHSGGIGLLLNEFEVGKIVTGEPDAVRRKLEQGGDVDIQPCSGVGEWANAVSLSFWQAKGAFEGNDASCVLTVQSVDAGAEWILPGDISAPIEIQFLRTLARESSDDSPHERVVIAPHHGSKTSSSQAWVRELNPDWVVYSAGYQHRYGHPHQDITERYRHAGAGALNTACSGSLVMTVVDGVINIQQARHQSPFWIGGPDLARAQCKTP